MKSLAFVVLAFALTACSPCWDGFGGQGVCRAVGTPFADTTCGGRAAVADCQEGSDGDGGDGYGGR